MDHNCGKVGRANMMKDGKFFRSVSINIWSLLKIRYCNSKSVNQSAVNRPRAVASVLIKS